MRDIRQLNLIQTVEIKKSHSMRFIRQSTFITSD